MRHTHYLLHQAPLPSLARKPGAGREVAYIVTDDGAAQRMHADPLRPEAAESAGAQPIERSLGVRDPVMVARLRAAISVAIAEGRAQVVMWRRSGTGTLLVVRPGRTRDTAVVSLEPLDAETQTLDPKVLVDLFGLSPSEADIAASLASDRSIGEIAKARTVGIETVRGQVKSLLRKMELNSQKQLVRVLTRVADALS